MDGADADAVRLLYGYYDCENIASLRAGRSAHNPLGNFTREELEEEVKTPRRLPAPVARVLRAFADPEGEDAEEVDTAGRFESALFGAYYEACSRSRSRFLRAWSEFDRNLRNVTAAVTARAVGRPVEEVTVGGGDVVEQLERSSAADFGLRRRGTGDVRLFRHYFLPVVPGAGHHRGALDAARCGARTRDVRAFDGRAGWQRADRK